jgi:hypothetical protein
MSVQLAVVGAMEDISELLSVAAQQGARALPEFIASDGPSKLYDPNTLFRSQPSRKLYLLPHDLAPVEVFTVPGGRPDGLERVNERTSPVVELIPSAWDGNSLRAGRLFLGLSASDSRYQYAKRLYDTLKKSLANWATAQPGGVKVGSRAAEMVARRESRLESFNGERLAIGEGRKR